MIRIDFHLVDTAEAEDGIADKRYNMAITIPNDFTKRALSIDRVSPEPIKLLYKLNESDNEITKAQAQKISGDLLNSFNQKVIDVFFASVIGNLQTAQTNVRDIVKKQDQLAASYTSNIHDPLKDYTSSLTQIDDSTSFTKDAFTGLNKELTNFSKDAQNSQDGITTVSQTMDMMQQYLGEGNDSFNNLVSLINENNNTVTANNTEESIQYLKDQQLLLSQKLGEDTSNLSSDIQTNLTSTRDNITQYTSVLNDRIDNTISTEVTDLISDSLNDSLSDPENKAKLDTLFLVPKSNIEKNILQTIDQLPSLDEKQLNNLDVSPQTKDQLAKIIYAAKKYANENGHPVVPNGQFSIQYYIQQMKQKLMSDGTVLTDEVKIPAQEAGNRTFTINAPNGFVTRNIVLTLPNGNVFTIQPGTIELPAMPKGKIKVIATFALVDPSIDILSPTNWSWTLSRHDEVTETALVHRLITPVSLPTNPVEELQSQTTDPTVEQPQTQPQPQQEDKTGEANKEADLNKETGNAQTEDDTKQAVETDKQDSTNPSDQNQQKVQPKENESEPTQDSNNQTKTITNDTIHHEIQTTLATQEDIPSQVVMSIWNYQRLQALFNLYFDIDVSNPEQFARLSSSTFEQIGSANSDSLYYALSNKGMKDFIISTIKQSLIDETTDKLSTDLRAVNDQINTYNDEINGILENFPTLMQQIDDATSIAQQQYDEIDLLLPQAEQWREASNSLVDSSVQVTDQNDKEGQVTIDLVDGISNLLTSSSTVAENAKEANLQASSVYDSFDNINKTATQVKNGSTEITNKADRLANDLVTKVSNDNTYAMNFGNVLANSKIGNAPNEDLYDFLSNPINMTKSSIENARDTRTTFYLIVIASFLALFTAYVMSGFKRFTFKKSDFENVEDQGIFSKNLPITLFTTIVAIIEGLIVGAVSLAVYKSIAVSPVIWITIVTLLMTLLVLAATYLLRQFKMLGMFIILLVISMYLFFTEALGFDFERSPMIKEFSRLSPLHYLENSISNVLNSNSGSFITMTAMAIGTIVFFVINLCVFKLMRKKEEVLHEA